VISRQKWGRLTGHRNPANREPPPPDELHVVSSDVTHMYPPVQGVKGGGGSYGLDVTVDPPVGGLGSGLLIAQAPRDFGDGGIVTAAVAAPDLNYFFLPGIWRLRARVTTTPRVALNRQGFTFNLLPTSGAFPWGAAPGFVGWTQALYVPPSPGSSGIQVLDFEHRLYIPAPWYLTITTGTVALVDGDVFQVHLIIDNEYLLDEPGSALAF